MPEGGAKWLTDRKGSLPWPERWRQGEERLSAGQREWAEAPEQLVSWGPLAVAAALLSW